MLNERERYELIDQYLRGELQGFQLEQFIQRLDTDKELAKEVKLHEMANEFVIESQLQEVKEELRDLYKQKNSGNWKWWTGAGVLLIAATAFFLISNKEIKDKESPVGVVISTSITEDSVNTKPITENKTTKIKATSKATQTKTSSNINNDLKIEENQILEKVLTNSDTVDHLIAINTKTENVAILPIDEPTETLKSKTDTTVTLRSINPCDNVKLEFSLTGHASCDDNPSGTILINHSLCKGKKPFSFSLDGYNFNTFPEFVDLLAGTYTVTLKDANNCMSQKEVTIKSKSCTNIIITPERGDYWEIPVIEGESSVTIFNSSGNIVYTNYLKNGTTIHWDGKSNNGSLLPMGSYSFIIKGRNGKVQTGSISIIR